MMLCTHSFAQPSSTEETPPPAEASSAAPQEGSKNGSPPPSQREALSEEESEAMIEGEDKSARLKALWIDFKRYSALYIEQSKEHKSVHDLIFKDLYKEQTEKIESRYQRPLKRAEQSESEQRRQSIERFKSFLESHPPHPQYTPDSLYRLAMLLLEEGDVTFLERIEAYNEKLQTASEDEDLPPPERDHRQVISAFTRLIRDWPEYRDLDGAFYARAHCYLEMGEEQSALNDFKMIIKDYPQSDYRTEVWNLIGELYFQFSNHQKAIEAYSEVIKDKSSQYYASAYYKLAWTYYRNDQFEDAVEHFKRLIEYSDLQVKKGMKGFELRIEALQYLAISLNEDDWDDDGIMDANAGFRRVKRYIQDESTYKGELLEAMVKIFFETSKYEDAIKSAKLLFKLDPFYKNNPEIHSKVVTAYERIAQPDRAFNTRDDITNIYVKDGPWYAFNHKDQTAIDQARSLMKGALLQAGFYHLEQAEALREQGEQSETPSDQMALKSQAKVGYKKASLAFERYLDRYKRDENTYELQYLLAETLFYSDLFPPALAQYIKVRDSKLSTDRKEVSSFSAIVSQLEIVRAAIREGKMLSKPAFIDQERDEVETPESDAQDLETASGDAKDPNDSLPRVVVITPEEIPALAQQAIQLREEYLSADLKNEEDPNRRPILIYKVGEIYLDYLHFDKARERFIALIESHPKSSVALAAAQALISTYNREERWGEMAKWADKIAQAGLGDEAVRIATKWKVGALFKKADVLFQSKKYAEAASEYISLVDQDTKMEDAPSALNNAAVAFERARMFDSATRTYERIFNQYPNSSFTENALFRVAYNAARFYDYDRAVRTYVDLSQRYPKGKHVTSATYNAARLLEQTQQYKRAAKTAEQYVKKYPDNDLSPSLLYSASKSYEKLGDTRNQIKVYQRFRKLYEKEDKHLPRIMEGLTKSIDIYKKKGNQRKVLKTRKELIRLFESRNLPPNSLSAKYTAEAAFKLIEPRFKSFSALKIKGAMKRQKKIIKRLQEEVSGLTEDYGQMLRYKSLDWNIAAFYRIGLLRQIFAEALYNLPMPSGLSEEEQDIYTTAVEDIAIPIEDEAVKRFETAYQNARKYRISNEWTRKILASLNKYKPSEYPTFKDEKRLEVTESLTTSQFIIPKPVQQLLEDQNTPSTSVQKPAPVTAPSIGSKQPKVPDASSPSPAPEGPQKEAPLEIEEIEVEEIEVSPEEDQQGGAR